MIYVEKVHVYLDCYCGENWLYNLLNSCVELLQVIDVDTSTMEVQLRYLKKEGDQVYSVGSETSWESMDVIVGVEPDPVIDVALSRRKLIYRFAD